jgi:Glu-tRNA(Gln) amidotransferase subunit E-like FAD-binding protein
MSSNTTTHSTTYQRFESLFHNIDQSTFAHQRIEHILALLDFCCQDGLSYIQRHPSLQSVVQEKCKEYISSASQYQQVVNHATKLMTLLTKDALPYDFSNHHC